MREFQIASEQAIDDLEDRETLELFEFKIGTQTFQARRPKPGETNVLFASRGAGESTSAVWRFLRHVLQGDGFYRLRDLVESGVIPPDLLFGGDELNQEGGIVDSIVKEFSGRPTGSSGDSRTSPPPDGQRSTGRARGKGSISSPSA